MHMLLFPHATLSYVSEQNTRISKGSRNPAKCDMNLFATIV